MQTDSSRTDVLSLARRFVAGIAAKDDAAHRSTLASDIDFRGLTPNDE